MAAYKPEKNIKKSDKLNSKLFGTWLNSILTQGRYVFMSSQRTFEDLLANDRNLRRSSISGEEFKSFNTFLLVNGFVEVVREPSKTKRQSGVYKIKHSQIRMLLNEVVAEAFEQQQMSQCIDLLEKSEKTSQKTPQKTSHEEEGEKEHELVVEVGFEKENETNETNETKKPSTALPSELPSPTSTPLVGFPVMLKFCLGSKNLKEKYVAKFRDFLDLAVNKNVELSQPTKKMILDQYNRVKQLDTKESIEICYPEYAQHLGLQISEKQRQDVHDIMASTFFENTRSDHNLHNMFFELERYCQSSNLDKDTFERYYVMVGRRFDNLDPYNQQK